MSTMRRFEQKTILVTGAAMGIGGATARRLGDEGAEVIVADCNEEAAQRKVAAIQKAGGTAWFQYVDLAQPSAIEQMGREVAARVSCLHGLVNNAGILRTASIAETGDADWEPQMSVNLRAPACARQRPLTPAAPYGPGLVFPAKNAPSGREASP